MHSHNGGKWLSLPRCLSTSRPVCLRAWVPPCLGAVGGGGFGRVQHENVKKALLLQGTKSSAVLKEVLTDIHHLKRWGGNSMKLSRKNENVRPFEAGGEASLEFLAQKTDCSLFMVSLGHTLDTPSCSSGVCSGSWRRRQTAASSWSSWGSPIPTTHIATLEIHFSLVTAMHSTPL